MNSIGDSGNTSASSQKPSICRRNRLMDRLFSLYGQLDSISRTRYLKRLLTLQREVKYLERDSDLLLAKYRNSSSRNIIASIWAILVLLYRMMIWDLRRNKWALSQSLLT